LASSSATVEGPVHGVGPEHAAGRHPPGAPSAVGAGIGASNGSTPAGASSLKVIAIGVPRLSAVVRSVAS